MTEITQMLRIVSKEPFLLSLCTKSKIDKLKPIEQNDRFTLRVRVIDDVDENLSKGFQIANFHQTSFKTSFLIVFNHLKPL